MLYHCDLCTDVWDCHKTSPTRSKMALRENTKNRKSARVIIAALPEITGLLVDLPVH